MREILFRAQAINRDGQEHRTNYKNGEWVYGIYNGKGGATSSYESYKNVFKLKRPPQSWCYVEEVEP